MKHSLRFCNTLQSLRTATRRGACSDRRNSHARNSHGQRACSINKKTINKKKIRRRRYHFFYGERYTAITLCQQLDKVRSLSSCWHSVIAPPISLSLSLSLSYIPWQWEVLSISLSLSLSAVGRSAIIKDAESFLTHTCREESSKTLRAF